MSKIVIVVEGGVVQEVYVSEPATKIILIDHDNLKAEGESRALRQALEFKNTAGLSEANIDGPEK